MARQSARRDRKNQGFPPCFISTLRVMWFRSANSHTGPQHETLHQEAGQMAASDYLHPAIANASKAKAINFVRSGRSPNAFHQNGRKNAKYSTHMKSSQFKTMNGHRGVEGKANGAAIKRADAAIEADAAFT